MMQRKELILRSRKGKMILLMLGSAVFVFLGIWLKGWFGIVFFGICFLVGLIQLLPGASQLTLTNDGFTMTSLFRSHFTRWEDIESFHEGYISSKKTVLFDYKDTHLKHRFGKKISKFLSGYDAGFTDTYGMKAGDLELLLNEWKSKSQGIG